MTTKTHNTVTRDTATSGTWRRVTQNHWVLEPVKSGPTLEVFRNRGWKKRAKTNPRVWRLRVFGVFFLPSHYFDGYVLLEDAQQAATEVAHEMIAGLSRWATITGAPSAPPAQRRARESALLMELQRDHDYALAALPPKEAVSIMVSPNKACSMQCVKLCVPGASALGQALRKNKKR